MVASDGYRGTPREPVNPSEGWRVVMDRRNRRNPGEIKTKISKLVDNALRETQYGQGNVAEVAPQTFKTEVPARSQTTGNFKKEKVALASEPRKKRWRRMRSWRPMSSFPNREEREVLNKNINTMTDWEFQRALAEYERNEVKLEEITEDLQEILLTAERRANRVECILRMQLKLQKKLHTAETKRLPSHYHDAAAKVYTNHAARDYLGHEILNRGNRNVTRFAELVERLKQQNRTFINEKNAYLSSAKDYITWWKKSLKPKAKPASKPRPPVPYQTYGEEEAKERHKSKIAGQRRVSCVTPRFSLRNAKLQRLDELCEDEFHLNGHGQGVARATEPTTFGIRFRDLHLPHLARREESTKGASRKPKPFKSRNTTADPNYGWDEESWSTQYYLELEKLCAQEQFNAKMNDHYEELDKYELQYDRIARANMVTKLTGKADEDQNKPDNTTPRTSSLLQQIASSKELANSIFAESKQLLKELEQEASEDESESGGKPTPEPVVTPFSIQNELAKFIRLNHPEILGSSNKNALPESIKAEALRLLQLHTPRDLSVTTKPVSSATKLMLESYSSLDETGQNQMWLAACQSNNKDLLSGIIALRKSVSDSGSKLAKLVKELLTHAEKAKIDPLRWHTQASQRRSNFHHWVSRIKDICAMFKETSTIMPKEKIIPYEDKKCIGNRALYQLILSKVDNHCRDLLRHCGDEGDTALELLFVKCANVTRVDTDHYHQLLVSLRAFQDESATRFIDRFLVARTSAERAQNEYTNSQLVSFLLTGLTGHKNASYQLLISIVREKIMSEEEISFEMLERRFLAIDETAARDYNSNRRLTSARAARSDRRGKGKGKKTARANAATTEAGGARDLSKLKCFNCQELGHYARDCTKPQRIRNNETSGSSLRRGRVARSQAAAAASNSATGTADPNSGSTSTPAATASTRSAGRVHWDHSTDARANAATSLRSYGCAVRRVALVDNSYFPYDEDHNCRIDNSCEDGALDDSYYAVYSVIVLDDIFMDIREDLVKSRPAWFGDSPIKRYKSICLLHNQNQEFIEVLRPNVYQATPRQRARLIIINGVMPVLCRLFGINPGQFPTVFKIWLGYVNLALERRFARDNAPGRVVVVTCDEYNINITFCPSNCIMHRALISSKIIAENENNEDSDSDQASDSVSDDDSCPDLVSGANSDSDSEDESESDSDEDEDDEEIHPFEWKLASAFQAKLTYIQALAGKRVQDPTVEEIGDPRDLRNFVADSGATDNMTPRRADLFDVVEGQNLGVEVADGHIIKCTTTGKIAVDMLDDEGSRVKAVLENVMYVPGLTQRLFSITDFVNNGNTATFERNALRLYFGTRTTPVTIQMANGRVSAMPAKSEVTEQVIPANALPARRKPMKRVRAELLHNRLGHRSTTTIIAGSTHEVWADVVAELTPDQDCIDCKIATIRASDRNKHPHTPSERFGQMVLMDIEHAITGGSLTPDSSLPYYLFIVDAYARYCKLYGLRDKSTEEVISAIRRFVADHGLIAEFGYINIDRLRADAGSQFTSKAFRRFCHSVQINLSLAAPKRLSQNHIAERTWQTVTKMARSMLVHARLPDIYYYHALRYATAVFNILPVKGVYTKEGVIGTPYELCRGHKPAIRDFKVFGCPCVAKKYLVTIDGVTQSKQTERGIRGVFVGFPENQKGFLIYVPAMRTIYVSGDVLFDEQFTSAIARTWRQFHDGLALVPKKSFVPSGDTVLSHTGSASDNFSEVEEGKFEEGPQDDDSDDESMPCLSHTSSHSSAEDDDYDDDANQYSWEADCDEDDDYGDSEAEDTLPVAESPMVVDDSANRSLRPQRERKAPRRLTMDHRQAAKDWSEAYFCHDVELRSAFATEVIAAAPAPIDASGSDASIFEPAPENLRAIMKLKNPKIKEAWIKAVYKELKVLISSGTFSIEPMLEGEVAIPTMETNRVKLLSDGTLDKLKNRIVVRGDLQNKQSLEDKWSPTASFRSLKMFLAHAARLKVRVRQMDFIGAFLQAKVRSRVFIKMPAIYGELFPDLKAYCGVPVRLVKSMYGMALSGKYWYQELQDWLLENGFQQSKVIACLFWKVLDDGSMIYLLDYVDDCLYFGTNDVTLKQFESQISGRFDLTLMGQAHWYLSTRITQSANFDITLDQSRYCLSIIRKYLDTIGCANVVREHTTPLPLDFVPTADDNSVDEAAANALSSEYNLDFASCVGALIYLALSRIDIIQAVNKMAKYTRRPGRNHFVALIHVLRYLRDNTFLGITFYSDVERSPIHLLLKNSDTVSELAKELFLTFSDSSWNDDVDTGRSTGCYLISYMGGIVDHSSNMPDPVAMSSAEAEYNEACLACMATAHMVMLLDELEAKQKPRTKIPLILDSKSAIAMGNSFKDTKHTRHILRRYHYVREGVDSGRFGLFWIKTDDELADIGTKQTPGPRHSLLTNILLVRVCDGIKGAKAAFTKLIRYKRGDSI